MTVKKIPGNVYAIIRFDDLGNLDKSIEDRVTVTRIVPDLETAKAEVARLNAVNASKKCHYVWQATRLADWSPDESTRSG